MLSRKFETPSLTCFSKDSYLKLPIIFLNASESEDSSRTLGHYCSFYLQENRDNLKLRFSLFKNFSHMIWQKGEYFYCKISKSQVNLSLKTNPYCLEADKLSQSFPEGQSIPKVFYNFFFFHFSIKYRYSKICHTSYPRHFFVLTCLCT